MEGERILSLLGQLIWNTTLISAPVLAAALATGLLISVLQVATQLQEMTLSYVPKLAVSAVVLMLLGGWMMGKISQFAVQMISLIPGLG